MVRYAQKEDSTDFLFNMTADLPRLSLVADRGLRIRDERSDTVTGH
jgi:hypothetical protein